MKAPHWATAPRPLLPDNAPTAGFICGGGGIGTTGLVLAGFKPIWNIDYDPGNPKLSSAIAEIYEHNFGHSTIQRTIQEVAASGFAGLETPNILVLTQSCCNFSQSNPNGRENESDLEIACAAAKAIAHFNPEGMLIENVREYATSRSWVIVKDALQSKGYSIAWDFRYSSSFGVPQNRERFLALAVRDGEAPVIPKGQAKLMGWYEAIADRIPLLKDAQPTQAQMSRVAKFSAMQLFLPLLVERVAYWNEPKVIFSGSPAMTIRKSLFVDGKNNSRNQVLNVRLSNGTWKNLGLREVARLFSIPDWFWLPDAAWCAGSAMGNGVPPLMMAALGEAIKPFVEKPSEPEPVSDNKTFVQVAREKLTPLLRQYDEARDKYPDSYILIKDLNGVCYAYWNAALVLAEILEDARKEAPLTTQTYGKGHKAWRLILTPNFLNKNLKLLQKHCKIAIVDFVPKDSAIAS